MKPSKLLFSIVFICCAAIIGTLIAALMSNFVPNKVSASTPAAQTNAGTAEGTIRYNPPKPEEAPQQIREAVILGYNILNDSQHVAKQNVGNKLTCSNCHFEGGRTDFALSLVGVAASYPKFRTRTNYSTDLVNRVNECFQRSMNGKSLDPEGKQMQAVITYLHWISRGLPIYGQMPWLGIKRINSDYKGDSTKGKQVWASKCASCHADNGEGTSAGPPVWGSQAYNSGAGMHRIDYFAAFSLATMPKGMPDLTPEQAIDVAAFVHAQPRPQFVPPSGQK